MASTVASIMLHALDTVRAYSAARDGFSLSDWRCIEALVRKQVMTPEERAIVMLHSSENRKFTSFVVALMIVARLTPTPRTIVVFSRGGNRAAAEFITNVRRYMEQLESTAATQWIVCTETRLVHERFSLTVVPHPITMPLRGFGADDVIFDVDTTAPDEILRAVIISLCLVDTSTLLVMRSHLNSCFPDTMLLAVSAICDGPIVPITGQ